jgi:hypothetical protein
MDVAINSLQSEKRYQNLSKSAFERQEGLHAARGKGAGTLFIASHHRSSQLRKEKLPKVAIKANPESKIDKL